MLPTKRSFIMSTVTVKTKEELKKAIASNTNEIIAVGALATNLKKSKKITTLGLVTLPILVAAMAAIPFTAGLSAVVAAPIAVLTGVEIAVIIAVNYVGIALVIAIYRDYDVVIETPDGTIIFKRK